MLRTIFALCVIGLPSVAQAANWRYVTSSGDRPNRVANWIDMDTLQRTGDVVTFRSMEVLESPDSTNVIRSTALRSSHCAEMSYMVLRRSYYTRNGTDSSASPRSGLQHAPPNSVAAALIAAACGRRELGASADDPEQASRATWRR